MFQFNETDLPFVQSAQCLPRLWKMADHPSQCHRKSCQFHAPAGILYTPQIKYILGLYLHRPATMMNFPVSDCLSGKQKVTRSDTFPFAPASRISNSMKPIRWWNNNNNNNGDKVPEDKGQRRRRCARSRVNSRGTGCRHTCPETTSGTSTTPDCWSARPYHLQGQEVTV